MAGQKITDLTKITTVAEDDLLVAVDVSDTGMGASGSNKGLQKRSLFLSRNSGWIPVTDTWEYLSVDDPIGVLTVPSDARLTYSVGMRIQLVNGGNTISGILVVVTETTLAFLHEINPANNQALNLIANSPITVPMYSTQKIPFGFPMDPKKWQIFISTTSNSDQSSPSESQYYNLGGLSINVPIGSWELGYMLGIRVVAPTDITNVACTLSISSNSESDSDYSVYVPVDTGAGSTAISFGCAVSKEKIITIAVGDEYFLLAVTTDSDASLLRFSGTAGATVMYAKCAYL